MIELILVSSDLNDVEQVLKSNTADRFYFTFIDSNSAYTKKDAYTLKTDWGAKKEPFCIVKERDNVLRCFYSESSDKVLDEALEFIKGLQETYD
jgi:hypothetical protein